MTFPLFFQRHAVLWSCAALLSVFLAGCGGDDIDNTLSERVSGPASNAALPIRIDATPTPSMTHSPTLTATPANQTPLPNATPTSADQTVTPSPDAKEIAPDLKYTPTPTPAPSPVETPDGEDEKSAIEEDEEAANISDENEEADSEDVGESEDEPKPVKLPVVAENGMKLEKFSVCSAIKNRNASGSATEFSYKKVKKIYTWTKFTKIKPPTIVKHHYYLNGKEVGTVKLTLEYSAMRSWSHKALTSGESIGKWKVVITTENDKEILAEQEFTVVK